MLWYSHYAQKEIIALWRLQLLILVTLIKFARLALHLHLKVVKQLKIVSLANI
jgi:hypothetical protein